MPTPRAKAKSLYGKLTPKQRAKMGYRARQIGEEPTSAAGYGAQSSAQLRVRKEAEATPEGDVRRRK